MVHLPGTPVGALVGYHLFVRPLLPGAEAAPVPARLGTLPDGGAQRRARPGLLAQPGRLRRGPEGAAVVDLLAGRRLAPYGRADAMVLQDGGAANPGDPVLVIAL